MPQAAVELHAAERVLPIDAIAAAIVEALQAPRAG
jgi:chemotaxis response regulator CheB